MQKINATLLNCNFKSIGNTVKAADKTKKNGKSLKQLRIINI